MATASYFRYWGKVNSSYPGEPNWRSFAYQSLDVASVGSQQRVVAGADG